MPTGCFLLAVSENDLHIEVAGMDVTGVIVVECLWVPWGCAVTGVHSFRRTSMKFPIDIDLMGILSVVHNPCSPHVVLISLVNLSQGLVIDDRCLICDDVRPG